MPLISSYGQISDKAFELVNTLPQLVYSGDIDQAVKNTIELGEIHAPLLDFPFNQTFSISLTEELKKKDPQKAAYSLQYFQKLSQSNSPKVNALIWPIVSWLNIREAGNQKDKSNLTKAFIEKLPIDTIDWKTANTYAFLILRDLDNNKLDNLKVYQLLFKRLQSHLLIRYQKNPDNDRDRYFLSYLWFYQCQKNPSKFGDFLCKAADVSPDLGTNGYFYDMLMLDYTLQRKGFKRAYYDYLIKLGKETEALPVIKLIAIQEPIDSNLLELKRLFLTVNPNNRVDFTNYWESAVSSICKPLPTKSFISDQGKDIEIWAPTTKWTYIDVWGTWCSPCREELPELQKLYTKNLQTNNSKLTICTWAWDIPSKMEPFMKEKGYTFPVILITKEIEKLFNITGYPTKILINPDGKYLKIPFGVDWKEYLMNYVGITSSQSPD